MHLIIKVTSSQACLQHYMLLLLRFLTFFQNPKKRDFYIFFALLHTFSRTMTPTNNDKCSHAPTKASTPTGDIQMTVVVQFFEKNAKAHYSEINE